MDAGELIQFFEKLEGPYKWYVIGFVLAIITAFVTRMVFKTLKWFLIIMALIVIGLAVWEYLR